MKIIAFVSFALCLAFIFSVPFRKKALLQKSGKQIFQLSTNTLPFAIVIFFASFFIIFASLYIRLRFVFKCVLCASSVLANFIASRESVSARSEGIFENGVVTNGTLFLFSAVTSFRILHNEKEMKDDAIIELTLKTGKTKEVLCKNADEAKRAFKIISQVKNRR